MQIGLVTYKPEKVEGYDLQVYYSKWADGQVFPAAKDMQNDVTVFCDAKAIREDPSLSRNVKHWSSASQKQAIKFCF